MGRQAAGIALALALTGCAGGSQPPSEASPGNSAGLWELQALTKEEMKLCMLSRRDTSNPARLAHIRFPQGEDAGILEFDFVAPGLNEAARQKASVVLDFDTGPLEGYMLRDFGNGFIGVRMTTYALSTLFEAFNGATRVKVTTSGASAVIDLAGLSEALPSLRKCAAP